MKKRNLFQLRISQNDHKDPKYVEELACILDKTRVFDEVWMATNYGLCSIDEIRQEVPKMRECAEILRKHGLIASMQISRTVGHAPVLMKTQSTKGLEGLKYDKVRTLKGATLGGRICYSGDDFRAYARESSREWGKAEVENAWVDDDVRLWTNQNAYCFCDTCISKFNKKWEYNFTYESFKEAFLAGDDLLRTRYHDFQVESLGSFARLIAEGINESSPDTAVGLQEGGTLPLAAASGDRCLHYMLDVTGKNPPVRVGGGFYDDHNPEDMLKKALKSCYMVSRLPQFVELRTVEIENLPFVSYGKSVECTALEASLYTAYGCNAASVTLMNRYEPLEYHEKIFSKLALYRPYIERAVAHNEGARVGGVSAYQPRLAHLAKGGDNPETVWCETAIFDGFKLMRLGIPYHTEPDGEVYYLSSFACDQITDEDMEILLRSPVILDGEALSKLCDKGYGALIGAAAVPCDSRYQMATYELPCDHPITEGLALGSYADSYYYCKDSQYLIEGEGIEPVLDCYSSELKERIGVGAAVSTTAYGARWFIKGRALANPVIPMKRRNMLINAINYIKEEPLCAFVKSYGQICCVPRVKDERTVSVTLLNVSVSEAESVEVFVAKPYGTVCKVIDPYSEEYEAELIPDGDGFSVKVGDLAPWRVKTVILES